MKYLKVGSKQSEYLKLDVGESMMIEVDECTYTKYNNQTPPSRCCDEMKARTFKHEFYTCVGVGIFKVMYMIKITRVE